MSQFSVGGVSYEFKLAGIGGYAEGRREFDREAEVKSITMEASKRALFRAAGLSRNSKSVARFAAAMKRLTRPVGNFPPVVRRWSTSTGGKVRLELDPYWIPRLRFRRVPWPPPTTGPTVLALYLFAFGTDLRPDHRSSVETETLYRRLGIPLSRPAHAERSLDRALAGVNKHLLRLNETGALSAMELPVAFEIEPLDRGARIHLRPIFETQVHKSSGFDEIDCERARRRLGLAPDEAVDEVTIERRRLLQEYRLQEQQKAQEREMWAKVIANLKAVVS